MSSRKRLRLLRIEADAEAWTGRDFNPPVLIDEARGRIVGEPVCTVEFGEAGADGRGEVQCGGRRHAAFVHLADHHGNAGGRQNTSGRQRRREAAELDQLEVRHQRMAATGKRGRVVDRSEAFVEHDRNGRTFRQAGDRLQRPGRHRLLDIEQVERCEFGQVGARLLELPRAVCIGGQINGIAEPRTQQAQALEVVGEVAGADPHLEVAEAARDICLGAAEEGRLVRDEQGLIGLRADRLRRRPAGEQRGQGHGPALCRPVVQRDVDHHAQRRARRSKRHRHRAGVDGRGEIEFGEEVERLPDQLVCGKPVEVGDVEARFPDRLDAVPDDSQVERIERAHRARRCGVQQEALAIGKLCAVKRDLHGRAALSAPAWRARRRGRRGSRR